MVLPDISKRLVDASRDQRPDLYFGQRNSFAIQRGNAASLLGTFPVEINANDFSDDLQFLVSSPFFPLVLILIYTDFKIQFLIKKNLEFMMLVLKKGSKVWSHYKGWCAPPFVLPCPAF